METKPQKCVNVFLDEDKMHELKLLAQKNRRSIRQEASVIILNHLNQRQAMVPIKSSLSSASEGA